MNMVRRAPFAEKTSLFRILLFSSVFYLALENGLRQLVVDGELNAFFFTHLRGLLVAEPSV